VPISRALPFPNRRSSAPERTLALAVASCLAGLGAPATRRVYNVDPGEEQEQDEGAASEVAEFRASGDGVRASGLEAAENEVIDVGPRGAGEA